MTSGRQRGCRIAMHGAEHDDGRSIDLATSQSMIMPMLRLMIVALVSIASVSVFVPARNHELALIVTRQTAQLASATRPSPHHVVLSMSNKQEEEESSFTALIQGSGLVAQPIVWVSLYFVATTGAGLPEGPFGLVGALEGVSYLIVVGLVGSSLFKASSNDGRQASSIAERLSVVTLAVGLLVLASLVAKQGCVPNAKPILDYSDYLPVCQATPGLFGE